MLDHVVRRSSTVLRRDVAPPAQGAPDVPEKALPASGLRCDDELPQRATLRQLIEAAPRLHDELRDRGRATALVITVVTMVALPSWTAFDVVLEPDLAVRFGLTRLLCTVPMLAGLWLLRRRPIGRRRPQLITLAVLSVAQIDIAWMATQVTHVESYALGLSLALYGSGCILSGPPRWTGALVGVTWVAVLGAVLVDHAPLAAQTVTAVVAYLGTASLIAVAAHVLRQGVALRELRARVGLERERERTRGLLDRLERLSHEDPLTGLANRRRWDVELTSACSEARAGGTSLAVVLLDVDHFKDVNDRHGHAGGDEALRAVSSLLATSVRGGDVVARLGGDELAVLMPGADLRRAVGLAESLRARALGLRPPGFEPGELTLSLGVAVAAGECAYPLELTSCADAQLYRAKITRNCVGSPAAEPAH